MLISGFLWEPICVVISYTSGQIFSISVIMVSSTQIHLAKTFVTKKRVTWSQRSLLPARYGTEANVLDHQSTRLWSQYPAHLGSSHNEWQGRYTNMVRTLCTGTGIWLPYTCVILKNDLLSHVTMCVFKISIFITFGSQAVWFSATSNQQKCNHFTTEVKMGSMYKESIRLSHHTDSYNIVFGSLTRQMSLVAGFVAINLWIRIPVPLLLLYYAPVSLRSVYCVMSILSRCMLPCYRCAEYIYPAM